MEFFNKIKTKIRINHILWIIFAIVASASMGFGASCIGFSSETQFMIRIGGSSNGIPMPNWLISCFMILAVIIFLAMLYSHLKALVKDEEYNKMMCEVDKIGDANNIGTLLSSSAKCKYAKGGELRYNENIIFHRSGSEVTIISPIDLLAIKSEIVKTSNSETTFVCIHHKNGVLKIKTSKKNVLAFLNELRGTFAERIQYVK